MELILTEDSKFLKIVECTQHEYDQLTLSLTKKIDSWRFHPLVKKGIWDGNVSFLKVNLIPSGLWHEVKNICEKYGFTFKIKGIRNLFDEDIDKDEFFKWSEELFATHENIKPRDYQIATAYNILKYRRCLAELATSAGKTLIMFLITSYLLEVKKCKRILFIVPNVSLVLQATGDFEEYNSIRRIPLKIQQIYAGVKIKPSSNIVIGTYQSLVKKSEDYFRDFDTVLVDECLHPDTCISMSDGSTKKISEVVEGEWVKTMNDITFEIEDRQVDFIYKNLSIDNQIYEIEMENGEVIKVTGNHKVKLIDGSYKRVDNLKGDEDIAALI